MELFDFTWLERKKNLTLADMISDILNLGNDIIKSFVLDNLKNEKTRCKVWWRWWKFTLGGYNEKINNN